MTVEGSRVGVDTNILVYAVDWNARSRHDLAVELMSRAADVGAVVPLQALAEFFAVATRKRFLTAALAQEAVESWAEVLQVSAADIGTLRAALRYVSRFKIAFWDAMILATVRHAGCTILLTEDFDDGAIIDDVEIVNPFRTGGRRRDLAAIFG